MSKCKICGSYAINSASHGRDGSDGDLCDVDYWRKRAELAAGLLVHDAEIIRLAIALVCAPAWSGISDEDCMLEAELKRRGYIHATILSCGESTARDIATYRTRIDVA